MAPATTEPGAPAAPAIATKATSRIHPDPEAVTYPRFDSNPEGSAAFFERAAQVASLLHEDEAIRDRGNVVPYRQVQLLKDSGLVTLLGPKSAGGGSLSWKEVYRVIRIVARGDGSLAQLLGYHYLWFWSITLLDTDDQRQRISDDFTRNRYFLGGAVNPRDSDLSATQHPNDEGKLVFDGKKTFSTGSKVSDITILEGALPDGTHVFAPVKSRQQGIVYGDEWVDTLGMRGTQSGGIQIDAVEAPWQDALGFVDKALVPLGPYNTLVLPSIQYRLASRCQYR
ncbi:hypothetical protein ACQY0O_000892 [Thecaphora frezii]